MAYDATITHMASSANLEFEKAKYRAKEKERGAPCAMDPADIEGMEQEYLPSAWWVEEPAKPKLTEWRKKICERFHEILVEEIPDSGDAMSITRRLMFEYRMEADPNSYAIMNLFVDRVRRAPRCFAMQFMAHLWSQERTHGVVLQVTLTT